MSGETISADDPSPSVLLSPEPEIGDVTWRTTLYYPPLEEPVLLRYEKKERRR